MTIFVLFFSFLQFDGNCMKTDIEPTCLSLCNLQDIYNVEPTCLTLCNLHVETIEPICLSLCNLHEDWHVEPICLSLCNLQFKINVLNSLQTKNKFHWFFKDSMCFGHRNPLLHMWRTVSTDLNMNWMLPPFWHYSESRY